MRNGSKLIDPVNVINVFNFYVVFQYRQIKVAVLKKYRIDTQKTI